MIKKISYFLAAIALFVFAVIQLKTNKEHTQQRVYQFDKEKPVSVQVITVKSENSEPSYTYPGTFEPNRETKISTDIQGKVNEVLVDIGNMVREGQTLIRLDNSLLRLQLETIEVQIEGLEADVKRYAVLAKAEAIQGVQLEKAELGLKSAKVQKATIIAQISKTEIKSPFSGIVTAKLTEEGAFAAPGIPLLQITDISRLRFTVNLPENELKRFNIGQLCNISADVYPETSLNGKISLIGSKANPGNSYPVQMNLENTADFKIKSGMFGKASLKTMGVNKQISIPASAIVGTNLQPQVYIVKNGKAVLRNITISERLENMIMVSDGLSEGDLIISNGFINLFDGANVNIK